MTIKEKLLFALAIVALCGCFFTIGYKWKVGVQREFSYQVVIKARYKAATDSIIVYDGSRKVGTVALDYGTPFAELILSDNE